MSAAVLLAVDGTGVDSTCGDRLFTAVAAAEVERTRADELPALRNEEVEPHVSSIRPLPGAVDLLRALHVRRMTVVLTTSGPPDHTEVHLDLLGAR